MKMVYVKAMKVARRIADRTGFLSLLEVSNKRGALWVRSLFGIYDSADLVQLDLPWWTFSAIDAVEMFLTERQGRARVYEYGAGASTVWLAKRCAEVNSVEHVDSFASAMAPIFSRYANIELRIVEPTAATEASRARSNRKGYQLKAFDDYAASIEALTGDFDLIVIDGRARLACLNSAVLKLAPRGIIVFDNSDRREYRKGIEASNLRETVYRGSAPALPYPSQTSILTTRR